MTEQEIEALRAMARNLGKEQTLVVYTFVRLGEIVLDTVQTCQPLFPEGVPKGPIYKAMAGHRITYDVFQAVVNELVKANKLREVNDLLFTVA